MPTWGSVLIGCMLVSLPLLSQAQCQSDPLSSCKFNASEKLYPEKFLIYGAYDGQLYTVGNVVMLVAKFPDSICSLPDPSDISPNCKPYMTVSVRTNEGNCYEVSSAPVNKLERNFGFSFADDPDLETNTGEYKHWAFPLYVVAGMSTSRLVLTGLTIPPECNSPRANFENTNLLQGVHLTPSIRIDSQIAAIVSIHTGKSAGRYTVGTIINIVVEFDKDVELSGLPGQYSETYINSNGPKKIPYGVPYLEMNSNALVPLRGYDSVRSKRKIAFLYEVGPGEETPPSEQLDVLPGTAIQLNGGAILAEGTGLDVNMSTMPIPGGEGALSHPTANKIFIYKTGEKFPPLKYDADVNPDTLVAYTTNRRGQRVVLRKTVKPTTVTVDLQLRSIFDVNERTQQFQADFVLITRWTDQRLRNPEAPAEADYDLSILESGQIWNPDLSFVNRRSGAGDRSEGSVRVYNTGRVVVIQRHITAFSAPMDLRDFPYDAQELSWVLRSGRYSKEEVRFRAASREAQLNASAQLRAIADPVFAFDSYAQSAAVPDAGHLKDFSVLTISVTAARVSGMATVTLIIPLCLICAAGCLSLLQDPAGDARLALPAAGAAATIVLSYVVAAVCPAVGYITRLHLLVLHTYVFSAVQLLANAYVRAICVGRRQLEDLNAGNRRRLKDADLVSRLCASGAQGRAPGPDAWAGGEGGAGQVIRWQEPAAVLGDGPGGGPSDAHTVDVGERPAAPKAAPLLGFWCYERMADTPRRPAAAADCAPGGGKEADFHPVKPSPRGGAAEAAAAARAAAAAAVEAAAGGGGGQRREPGVDWGGGPVPILFGLATVTNENSAAWAEHVRWVEQALRAALPAACALSVALILVAQDAPIIGARGLAGGGVGPASLTSGA